MEKIMLAVNTEVPDMSSIDFACYLGSLTRSGVTGVFLNNISAGNTNGNGNESFGKSGTNGRAVNKRKITPIMASGMGLFRTLCENKGVHCRAHHEIQGPSLKMLAESRYADLIILDPEMAFSEASDTVPGNSAKEILDKSECPVVISPEQFSGIDELVFASNGSASCLFAIKQFTYMFPQLNEKKLTILEMDDDMYSGSKEGKCKLRGWLQNHYSKVDFEILNGNSDNELFYYLLTKRNAMVILGAYGRCAASLFRRRSKADQLIKAIVHPIFIAHQ